MRKTLTALFLCFIFSNIFAQQSTHKVSAYLSAAFSKTVYDRIIGNNPWGMGLGLQAFLNTPSKFKLTMEVTGDLYLESGKVYYVFQNGDEIKSIDGVVNIFAGASFHPNKTGYFSLVAGPSFINNRTCLGIKPSMGFYFSEKQRWGFKVFYTNIFNREEFSKKDFGTIGFSIGCRLF
ncbi:MAG: hypothetical protein ABI480_03125 [Chitinophagaceae bacterium]